MLDFDFRAAQPQPKADSGFGLATKHTKDTESRMSFSGDLQPSWKLAGDHGPPLQQKSVPLAAQ
jgi:hypothetical protein